MIVIAILYTILTALIFSPFVLVYLYCVPVRFLKKRRFLLALISAVTPFSAYKVLQYYWYAQAVPAEIQIAYPVAVGDQSDFREGCGVAVYKLTATSLEGIKKNGLRFFENAIHGRGYVNPSDNDYHYYTYQPWRKTPVPTEWTNQGSWFMCSVVSGRLEEEIIVASKQHGAYYTVKAEGELLVIPSLGYVVFSYNG